jgi:hypothetical protein
MNARWKIVVGSLVGAVAIHGVLAACGSASTGFSRDGGILDALADAFHGSDAKAGTDGGGESCSDWQIMAASVSGAPAVQDLGTDNEPFAVTFNPTVNEYLVWTKGCH